MRTEDNNKNTVTHHVTILLYFNPSYNKFGACPGAKEKRDVIYSVS